MQPQDVGIKMSVPGFDVNTVPDANVYFSSAWPWLKIQDTQQLTVTADQATNGIIIPHTLGYPPFVMITSSRYGFGFGFAQVTAQRVTIPNQLAGDQVRYIIFRLPLNKAYKSPTLLTTPDPQQFVDPNHGIKWSKEGKSVDSDDLRDFTIHSGTRSPLLHTVAYGKCAPIVGGDYNAVNGLEWKNDLPYLPEFFPFFSADGIIWTQLFVTAQVPPKVNFDESNGFGIVANNIGKTGGFASIIVLKDPYNTPNQVTVTI